MPKALSTTAPRRRCSALCWPSSAAGGPSASWAAPAPPRAWSAGAAPPAGGGGGGASVGVGGAAGRLRGVIAGGIAAGVVVGLAMLFLAGQSRDPLVQITSTTVAAYGSFLAAEHFHCSGVLASLAAGLLMGNSRL